MPRDGSGCSYREEPASVRIRNILYQKCLNNYCAGLILFPLLLLVPNEIEVGAGDANLRSRASKTVKYTLTKGTPDNEPRHIHNKVTIVAAELDPHRCHALACTGGPWWPVGALQTLCCSRAPVPCASGSATQKLTGTLRVSRPKPAKQNPKRTSQHLARLPAIRDASSSNEAGHRTKESPSWRRATQNAMNAAM